MKGRKALAIMVAGFALLSSATAAAAQQRAWTPEAPAWDVWTKNDVPIKMSDGVTLRAAVGVPMPRGASEPRPGDSFPVLVEQTPYRKDGGLFTVDSAFVGRGFAFVVVDVRGTGSSQGSWDSFGAREQQDGPEILNWVLHQRWSNGRLGLMGASYLAINQLLTLEQTGSFTEPDSQATVEVGSVLGHVQAIFPVVPMSDAYRDVTYHGGNLDDAFIVPWLGLVTALGLPPPHQISNGNPSSFQDAINVWYGHGTGATQFQVPTAGSALTGGDASYDGPFSRLRSPIVNIERVHVPTFMIGGEFDIFQRGEPLLYQALHVPYKKLIIGPWIHLQGAQASSLPADGLPNLQTLQLAWFEHYLKDVDTGIDSGPRVYQYELKGTDDSHFVASADYPIRPWTPSNLYLVEGRSGSAVSLNDGLLSWNPPAGTGSDLLPYVPTGTGCSRTTFQWGDASTAQAGIHAFPCETDERPSELQELTYTTPILTQPLTIDGPINVHLVAESPLERNITFTVRVTDVAPSGMSTQLSAGWLLASLRAEEQNPVTLTAQGKLLRVYHPFTPDSVQRIGSGPTAYDIEVFPTYATFQPGHRIRLDIGTGDTPHMAPSAPNQAASAGSFFLVDRNSNDPSYVTLPTMGGAVVSAGSFAGSAGSAGSGTGNAAAASQLPFTSAPAAATPQPLAAALLALLLVAGAGATWVRRRRH